MHTDEDEADHSTEEIFDFRINKKRKDFITDFKDCLMYKIKYIEYNENNEPLI